MEGNTGDVRRRLPAEVRRAQVLDAALRLLHDRGYAALNVESIAREAGVSKTIVYNAYGGLEELLHALLDREEHGALKSLIDAAPAGPLGADPSVAIRAWTDSLLAAIASNPVTWRLMLVPPHGTPGVVRARVQRGRDIALDQLRGLLRPAVGGGDVDLAARLVLAAAEEGARLLLDQPDEFPPERLARFAAEQIARFV